MITERRLSDGSVHVAISGTKINQTDESHRVHVFFIKNYKNQKCFIKFEIQVLDSNPVNMKKYTVTV